MESKEHETHHDYMLTILLIGDTGKTSFISQTCEHIFVENNTFQDKQYLKTHKFSDGETLKSCNLVYNDKICLVRLMEYYDIEKFRTNISMYKICQCVFILFDVCDMVSFNNVASYIGECERYTRDGTQMIIIGCKTDKVHERVVNQSDAIDYSQKLNIPYFEVNSKDPSPIERQTFDSIIQTAVNFMIQQLNINYGDNNNSTTPLQPTILIPKTKSIKSKFKLW